MRLASRRHDSQFWPSNIGSPLPAVPRSPPFPARDDVGSQQRWFPSDIAEATMDPPDSSDGSVSCPSSSRDFELESAHSSQWSNGTESPNRTLDRFWYLRWWLLRVKAAAEKVGLKDHPIVRGGMDAVEKLRVAYQERKQDRQR